jgi:hypothetical protein
VSTGGTGPHGRIRDGADFRNAMRAFLDKRRYDWTGQ